jgi:4-amino-4-deoxy-L-arabinose transferase-like glycosyltransferase
VTDHSAKPVVPADSQCKSSHAALIAAMCLILYLAGNGRVSLWDRDEAWYSQTAREMVQRGDYVVPTFNGEPRYRKPVLIYWLMTAAYSVFGDNEAGARFASGVAGAITCMLTYRLGARMAGRSVGLAAAAMLAVAPFMVVESKLATTDSVLTAMIVGALSCIWELYVSGFSWRWSLGFWSLIGGTILTKGPFGLLFIITALVAWMLLSRQWSVVRRLNWGAGLVLVLAMCLPWCVAIYRATDGEFYRVAIGEQALGHSMSAMNEHRGFPGFYLVLALGGLLPWTLGITGVFAGFRQWSRELGPRSFLLGWIAGPMVMVEIMRTKLPQYYLPAFPAWALLIAHAIVAFQRSQNLVLSPGGRRRVIVWAALGVGSASLVGALAVSRLPADLLAPFLAVTTILGAGSAVTTVAFWRARDRLGWSAAVGTWWAMQLVLGAWLLPSAEQCRIARRAGEALRGQAASGDSVVLFGYREPSLVFYVGRPLPSFGSPKELAEYLASHDDATTTLLRDQDCDKLRTTGFDVELLDRIEASRIRGMPSSSVSVAHVRLSGDEATAMRALPVTR